MMIAVILGLLALGVVYLEFYLPGGVMAVIGATLACSAVGISVYHNGYYGLIFAAIETFLMIVTMQAAVRGIRKQKGMCLVEDQQGFKSGSFDVDMIGKEALVLTDLKPSGFILVDGVRCQATSSGQYVKKQSKVIIIGGEGSHVIVR